MSDKSKVVLITGSSRGIGRAVALVFASRGWDVVVHHRVHGGNSEANAEATCEAVRTFGQRALRVTGDISERAAVSGIFKEIQSTFGTLHALILNAARAPFKPLEKLLEREIRQLMDTNFLGNILCVKEALPLMENAEAPSIVFISSLGSRFYSPSYPLGAMKGAMESAVTHLAESLSERGIRVNAVCGGIVKTDSFKVLRTVWDGLDQIPDAWCVTPEEIAEVVHFFCTPAARAIRGQTLVVDHGIGNRLHM